MFHLTQASLALTRLTVFVRGASSKKRFDFLPSFFASLFHQNIPSFFLLRLSIFLSPVFPSFNLLPLLLHSMLLSLFSIRSTQSSLLLFFCSLTSKCFVRANFNENRVITSEVQETKGKTDARSKKKRVGDPR